MEVEQAPLRDVMLVKPKVFGDERGYFLETWHEQRYAEAGIPGPFVQDNHSRSQQHILRGLHYQIGKPQGKLVRVSQGSVFDVVVDLRCSSPTFKQWWGVELSADNHWQLWIPEGFAHGFYVLSETAEFLYKCTELYSPEHERCLRWNDPELGIDWPLIDGTQPVLSAKDAVGQGFSELELFD